MFLAARKSMIFPLKTTFLDGFGASGTNLLENRRFSLEKRHFGLVFGHLRQGGPPM